MSTKTLKEKVFTIPAYFLALGFGSGLLPKAPGTWGTVAAVPLYALLCFCSWPVYITIVIIAFILGVFICDIVAKDMQVHDAPQIVWDEIVGYWLTMFLAPIGWTWALAGFILFRIFDIWKPQPIRFFDAKIHGGLGIMLDDIIAAVFAWIVLQGIAWGIGA